MELAIEEARRALDHGDVPIGALCVIDGTVVAQGHNEKELRRSPLAHAETLVVQRATEALGETYLDRATLYVTLEPCAMCAGALVQSRLKRLIFGAYDPKSGACGSLYNLCCDPRLNHEVELEGGLLAEPSGDLLRSFFQTRR